MEIDGKNQRYLHFASFELFSTMISCLEAAFALRHTSLRTK